ncbi:MAG: T9SS type A sorting domain-containing protein [Bacteroidales bacterium]|nr:T9SS type A sorting domain-containing protein [Bacteroidales bacterium]
MKKILCFIAIVLMGIMAFAQTVTLTFTGRDAANHYVQLNRVEITNLTKNWQETIYWPDTTLKMQNGTGIDESVANGAFVLSQNNPNPFSRTTDVNLTVADAGVVTLEIVDGNGRIIGTRRGTSLPTGTHQFRVSLSATGTYVMTARQNGKTSSIKMVCNGGGNTNDIEYLGMAQTITYVLKSTTTNPFNFGDMMEYVGYATINDTEEESQHISQAQGGSETFVLQFDAIQLYVPVLSTDSISDVTPTSATCGGNITNDGGANVTNRGVCFNTTGTPTVNDDSTTTDGNGVGSFVSSLSGLTPYTLYYVRAYATNSVGTGYGEEVSFTTLCILPEVYTLQPDNISPTSFTCEGNVSAINCDALTARGVCWNTTGNPSIADNHTTDSIAAGSIISSITGLACSTTYYVCAYATNAAGTSYGEVYEITTLAPAVPDVTTLSASLYNGLSMIVASEVTDENCESVSSRGICYSTSPNPTISDSLTIHSVGLGTIIDTIIGLDTNTTYYVRAYATNSVGTAYGVELSVTTPTLPTVTTDSVTNITTTTAKSGGKVTNDGGATVTARGVCWSTSQNPTISDSHTTNGSGTGSFNSSITGLSPLTTYYVRAYATNSVGTTYGEEVSFTPPFYVDGKPCYGTSTLTDIDGNTYNTVVIGTQCWMKENLRTTKYADNTSIAQGSSTSTSSTTAYWYYLCNNSSNKPTYGLQYNWKAVMHNSASSNTNHSGVQGICPTGWHVPSAAEWQELINYLSSQSQYWCSGNSQYTAKSLASTTGWYSNTITCTPGNTPSNNNATDFSALPLPDCSIALYSYFWSATSHNTALSKAFALFYGYANPMIRPEANSDMLSVRCVRDDSPIVITDSVTNLSFSYSSPSTYVICGGKVTSAGPDSVTARGVCWSTSPYPTINDSHTTDGSGTGSFTSIITGLTAGTTYYVRAYATGALKTGYGQEVSFTTIPGYPCPAGVVTDIDGNTYNTVLIGTQCWMRENLRTTKYADNTSIEYGGGSTSSAIAYYYCPDNNISNKPTYGLLYNWKAVMRNASSSNANPSGVQGLCPTGWHVPSEAEWTQLTNYVNSQNQYRCSGLNNYIAKSLACTTGWNSSTTTCTPGYMPSNNNATGFSALPAGNISSSSSFGSYADFWSTTKNVNSIPEYFKLDIYNTLAITTVNLYTYYYDGFSVRCVRDELGPSCPGTPTLTDIDSNVYNTVQIGNQCWMRENLRTTKYADGSSISQYNWYYPNNDTSTKATLGLLYKWSGVMYKSYSSNANPSGVQGICPTGWHVPSDAEWTQLITYVRSQSQYVCGSTITQIAKALADTTGWNNSTNVCAVGDSPSSNNSTCFSALPAGYFDSDGNYSGSGIYVRFWSATSVNNSQAYMRGFSNNDRGMMYYGPQPTSYGFSVSCLKD